VDYNAREHVADHKPLDCPEAMLLIGDKVVTNSPPAVRYPHQLDLGAAWVDHTGLPFVFAMWMADADTDPALLASAAAILDCQRRHNSERTDWIIHHRAKPRHWPGDLAGDYLKSHITYEFNESRLAGLNLFYDKALEHGLIRVRQPLAVFA
jgi:chorismate dehydratase